MNNEKFNTNLPKRRLIEDSIPEKKPKWCKILGMIFWGILIWIPRLFKVIEAIENWFNQPPS